MFIYKITNVVNQKVYIGQTINKVETRWQKHVSTLKKGNHSNSHLQSSWNKYGEISFIFETLETLDKDMNFSLDNLERYWIKHFDSMNPQKGYNKESGGNTNKVKSKDTIQKWKDNFIGKYRAEKSPNFGRKTSNETKIIQSKIKMGNKCRLGTGCKVIATNLGTNERIVFSSAKEAAEKTLVSQGNISNICCGRRKQSLGFKFEYMKEVN